MMGHCREFPVQMGQQLSTTPSPALPVIFQKKPDMLLCTISVFLNASMSIPYKLKMPSITRCIIILCTHKKQKQLKLWHTIDFKAHPNFRGAKMGKMCPSESMKCSSNSHFLRALYRLQCEAARLQLWVKRSLRVISLDSHFRKMTLRLTWQWPGEMPARGRPMRSACSRSKRSMTRAELR